jgi:protein-disulfide isomerase
MKRPIIKRLLVLNLAMILSFGMFEVQAQTLKTVKSAERTTTSDKTATEAIEKIVREYLLKNPSIIREALDALQAQEAREKQLQVASNLKMLKKELYFDPESPTAGNPEGDVSIVVFFDYNCGYCKTSMPAVRAILSRDSSIRVVYKEFPILGPQSEFGAMAALAANRQGKYSAFQIALLESDEINDKSIKAISDKLGLNYAALRKDMDDPKIAEALMRNLKLAQSLSIDGTPGYIVGEQIIPGAIDAAVLADIVKTERTRLSNSITASGNNQTQK